jgi:hypothetical protein
MHCYGHGSELSEVEIWWEKNALSKDSRDVVIVAVEVSVCGTFVAGRTEP